MREILAAQLVQLVPAIGAKHAQFVNHQLQPFDSIAVLAVHDHSDVRVRFDRVSVRVVGEDRAFIKHLVNCVDAA